MKKTFISMLLVLVLCLTLGTVVQDQNQPTFADDENAQYIMTMGYGEIFTEADTVELNFGLTKVSDTLENGNTDLNTQLDTIKNAIKNIDTDAKVNIGYFSSYPISHAGTLQYQFNCNFVITSTNPENRDEIITTVAQNGATSFHGACLELSNKQDAYNQALTKAKDDAEQKAKALYGNVTLKDMFEVSLYSHEQNGEIRVEACVKAKFQINGIENTPNNNQPEQLPSTDNSTPNQNQNQNENPQVEPNTPDKEVSPVTPENEAPKTNEQNNTRTISRRTTQPRQKVQGI